MYKGLRFSRTRRTTTRARGSARPSTEGANVDSAGAETRAAEAPERLQRAGSPKLVARGEACTEESVLEELRVEVEPRGRIPF